MEEERQMGSDDSHKALAEVPVPGVGAIELCHIVQYVKL